MCALARCKRLPFPQPPKAERVIVGGFSPAIRALPRDVLSTGQIIGINHWAAEFPCDYWIGLDTGLNWHKYHDETEYLELPKFLRTLKVPQFMRLPNPDSEAFVPHDAGIFFEKPHAGRIPTEWDGTLQFTASTALAAINLAIVLGASEVVLYGVDFVGNSRADGSDYGIPDLWEQHREGINALMRRFQEIIPIYKTHPDSWLDCPFMELTA